MSKEKKPGSVALIEDPFQINTLEIAEAQQNSDELDLDEDFEMIAEAIAESEQAQPEVTEVDNSNSNSNSDADLEAQIAEDQALEKELAEIQETENDAELEAALPKNPLDLSEMQSCIEALLFMSDKPLTTKKLHELLGPDFSMSIFQEAVTELKTRYEKSVHHGIEIVEIDGGFQFRTKPGRSALAKKLAKTTTQRLSTGAMESLAIIAYRQPVMKENIDKIRGVDSSYFIRALLDKKLIQISGRSELPGRPMLYSTTPEFLSLFGLKDLAAMPSLREIEQMVPASQTANPNEEDPRVRRMRDLVSEMKSDHSTNLAYDPGEDEKILHEIKERVSAIPTSTPYLEEQKELEKQAKLLQVQSELAPVTAQE